MTATLRRERGLVALLLFAVAGIGASAYLTAVHYADVAPVCAGGGPFDCAAVTQSSWSVVPGTSIPVTVPGLLFFIVSGALAAVALSAAARGVDGPRVLARAHAALAGAAMLAVFYFVYVELVELHRICEWCTAVHVLVLASFVVAATRLQAEPAGEAAPDEADTLTPQLD